MEENKEFLELMVRFEKTMTEKNILINVYTNACGFLWDLMKTDSGTNLGCCEFGAGDDEASGTFTSFKKAMQDALDLIDQCDLKKFYKECPKNKLHWSNYALHLHNNYRKNK